VAKKDQEAGNKVAPSKEFTGPYWDEIGQAIAGMCNDQSKEFEHAWLKGTKLKIGFSVTIGDGRPVETKIKMNCTAKKISEETILHGGAKSGPTEKTAELFPAGSPEAEGASEAASTS